MGGIDRFLVPVSRNCNCNADWEYWYLAIKIGSRTTTWLAPPPPPPSLYLLYHNNNRKSQSPNQTTAAATIDIIIYSCHHHRITTPPLEKQLLTRKMNSYPMIHNPKSRTLVLFFLVANKYTHAKKWRKGLLQCNNNPRQCNNPTTISLLSTKSNNEAEMRWSTITVSASYQLFTRFRFFQIK